MTVTKAEHTVWKNEKEEKRKEKEEKTKIKINNQA